MNTDKRLHVLLVEDSPTDVLLAQEALESGRTQFQLENVQTLAEAVDLLHVRTFDVVLLDLGLPDSQGLDTLRQILSNTRLPVVVMTGTDDEELSVKAVHEGAQDYIVKGAATAPPKGSRKVRRSAVDEGSEPETPMMTKPLQS
jgi:phosphoserine phosphatase RsbU/P